MSTAVSVVMPIHNGEKYLRAQIASVLEQLKADDELIIVDDASADDSVSIAQDFRSPIMSIIRNPRNLGVIESYAIGLGAATREVIFLCDQDDVWLPGKRAAFVQAFERAPSTVIVISDAQLIDDVGRVIGASFMTVRGGFKGGVFATVWRNRYLGCAMAIRRSLLRRALPIPALAPMHDMWLGLLGAVSGDVCYLSTPYLQYRRHASNSTPLNSKFQWLNLIRWRLGLVIALVQRLLQPAP